MKRICGKSNQFLYFQARESLSPINIPIPIPASNRGGPEPKRGFGWSGGRVGVSISGWNFLNVFGRYLVHRTKFRFHGFAPNKALAAEGFLLTLCRIAFVPQDFASPLTCLDLPRLASTCLDLPSNGDTYVFLFIHPLNHASQILR